MRWGLVRTYLTLLAGVPRHGGQSGFTSVLAGVSPAPKLAANSEEQRLRRTQQDLPGWRRG